MLTPEMFQVEYDLMNKARLSHKVKENNHLDSFFDHLLTNNNEEYPDPCKENAALRPDAIAIRPGEKVVVTEKGIDDWRAQLYGHRLHKFPNVKPQNMPEHIYWELKAKYVDDNDPRSKSYKSSNISRITKSREVLQNS